MYNFPVAIENCMRMCRIGGHVCLWTPANNECGHGFYQFSPELFFRLFCPDNGFDIRRMVFMEKRVFGSRWYDVNDPAAINSRVSCVNRHPLFLMVLAKKNHEMPAGGLRAYQADYVEAWSMPTTPTTENPPRARSRSTRIKDILKAGGRHLPRKLADRLLDIYSTYYVRRLSNRNFYRQVDPDRMTF